MNTIHPSFQQLLPALFPAELLQFFEVAAMRETRHPKTGDVTLTLVLHERNTPPVIPPEHRGQGKRVVSKGFHRPVTLQHFPIQDRLCRLEVHRRRWEIDGGGTLQRTLDFLPLKGLKITSTFGDFLKETDPLGTGGDRADREALPGGEA